MNSSEEESSVRGLRRSSRLSSRPSVPSYEEVDDASDEDQIPTNLAEQSLQDLEELPDHSEEEDDSSGDYDQEREYSHGISEDEEVEDTSPSRNRMEEELLEDLEELFDHSQEEDDSSGDDDQEREYSPGIYEDVEVEGTSPSTNRITVELQPEVNSTTNVLRSESSGNDDNSCAICYKPYSSAANHQASCLRTCGHVYGLFCIQKWIREGHLKCPFCNKECSSEDVVKLYASGLSLSKKTRQEEIAEVKRAMTKHFQKELKEYKKEYTKAMTKYFQKKIQKEFKRIKKEKDEKIREMTISMKKRRKLNSPSECNGEGECQLCMSDSHQAIDCPYLNSKCEKANCGGFRMMISSKTSKNPDRVFLKCTACASFEWMDSSTSPKKFYRGRCFACWEEGHSANNCTKPSNRL